MKISMTIFLLQVMKVTIITAFRLARATFRLALPTIALFLGTIAFQLTTFIIFARRRRTTGVILTRGLRLLGG